MIMGGRVSLTIRGFEKGLHLSARFQVPRFGSAAMAAYIIRTPCDFAGRCCVFFLKSVAFQLTIWKHRLENGCGYHISELPMLPPFKSTTSIFHSTESPTCQSSQKRLSIMQVDLVPHASKTMGLKRGIGLHIHCCSRCFLFSELLSDDS